MKKNKLLKMFLVVFILSSLFVGCAKKENPKPIEDQVIDLKEASAVDEKDEQINLLKKDLKEIKFELADLREAMYESFEHLQESLEKTVEENAKEEIKEIEVIKNNPLDLLPEELELDLQEVLNIKSVVFANAIAAQSKDVEAFKNTIIPSVASQEAFEDLVQKTFDEIDAKFILEEIKVIYLDGEMADVEVTQFTEISQGEKDSNRTVSKWLLEKHEGDWRIGEIETMDMIFSNQ